LKSLEAGFDFNLKLEAGLRFAPKIHYYDTMWEKIHAYLYYRVLGLLPKKSRERYETFK